MIDCKNLYEYSGTCALMERGIDHLYNNECPYCAEGHCEDCIDYEKEEVTE